MNNLHKGVVGGTRSVPSFYMRDGSPARDDVSRAFLFYR